MTFPDALPAELLSAWARRAPRKPAIVEDGRALTWAELDDMVSRLAAGMAERGISAGEVVGTLAKDRIETMVILLACLRLGAVRVGINWRYSQREILHVIRDSDARMLFVGSELARLLDGQLENLTNERRTLVSIGTAARPDDPPLSQIALRYQDLLSAQPRNMPRPQARDLAMISYTSGTTGLPKGVLLSQDALRANILQTVLLMGLKPDDVWYQATSLAWYACVLSLLGLVNGMTVVLPGGEGFFNVKHFLETIEQHRVTSTMLAPVMISRVLDELAETRCDISSFRTLCYGSAPTPPALLTRVREALPHTELVQIYGVTEGGYVSVLTDTDHRRGMTGPAGLLTSCGRPGVGVDLIIADQNGNPLPPNQTGEVWLRSRLNCMGYHNLPKQSASLITDEGYVRTNDIGRMDEEGFLYLIDRKNFMIITGGMNVFPSVVENVLAQHPAVNDVAVVGVPHPEWGQAVAAVVEPTPGPILDPADLILHCREHLGAFEVPKHIVLVDKLPRGVTGKILKPKLIQLFADMPEQLPWYALESAEAAAVRRNVK
jgi:acyl-CoA synthetase (AMP-forming)/AMP-acid ligase II